MSFTHSLVALLLVLSAPLTQAPTQTIRPPKQYTIEQFLNTTSISGASFSADESPHPVLVEQDRHLERVHHSSKRRLVDADHLVNDRFDLRRFIFPDRRPHPDHARPGRQRAEPSLRPNGGRRGARSDAGREAEGEFPAVVAGRLGILRARRTSAMPRPSTSIATTRRPTRARCSTRTRRRIFPAQVSDDGKWVSLVKITTTNDTDVYVWSAADETDDPRHAASGAGQLLARRVRSIVRPSLLHIERRRRIRAPAPLRARRRATGRRRKSRLGHRQQRVLALRASTGRRS